jgi:hypothetical protein
MEGAPFINLGSRDELTPEVGICDLLAANQ